MCLTIVLRLCELPVFLFVATLFALPLLPQTIRIDRTTGHAINSFIPTETLGAGIDRLNSAATDKLFAEPVMKEVLSAGWQTVSIGRTLNFILRPGIGIRVDAGAIRVAAATLLEVQILAIRFVIPMGITYHTVGSRETMERIPVILG